MKTLAYTLLFLAAAVAGYAYGGNECRFTKVYTQANTREDYVKGFEVWRDTTTGQEFVCAFTNGYNSGMTNYETVGRGLTCLPTGRNWK